MGGGAEELIVGLVALDNAYGGALSGSRVKSSQRRWCQGEGEKLRAMIAYIRTLKRKTGTSNSRIA